MALSPREEKHLPYMKDVIHEVGVYGALALVLEATLAASKSKDKEWVATTAHKVLLSVSGEFLNAARN